MAALLSTGKAPSRISREQHYEHGSRDSDFEGPIWNTL